MKRVDKWLLIPSDYVAPKEDESGEIRWLRQLAIRFLQKIE